MICIISRIWKYLIIACTGQITLCVENVENTCHSISICREIKITKYEISPFYYIRRNDLDGENFRSNVSISKICLIYLLIYFFFTE